jgi:hypothetical protein
MAEGFCRRGGWARTNDTFLSPVHAGLQFLSRLEPWTFDTPTRTAMDVGVSDLRMQAELAESRRKFQKRLDEVCQGAGPVNAKRTATLKRRLWNRENYVAGTETLVAGANPHLRHAV